MTGNCNMWIGNANIKLNSVKSYNKIINVTVEVSTNYDKIQYLENELRPLPLQISNEDLRNAKLSLEDSETILDNIGSHQRTQTWVEKWYKTLEYVGYSCIGIVLFMFSYKLGFPQAILEMIRKCFGNCYNNCSFVNTASTNYQINPEVIQMLEPKEIVTRRRVHSVY